jgi:hypothetical protein
MYSFTSHANTPIGKDKEGKSAPSGFLSFDNGGGPLHSRPPPL